MDLALSTSLEKSHKTHTTPSVTDRLTSEAGLDTLGHFIVTEDSIKSTGCLLKSCQHSNQCTTNDT